MRRSLPLVAAVAAGLLLSAGAGAVAVGLVTSAKIQDNTIRSRDVHDGTLRISDLARKTVEELRGARGQTGPQGPQGTAGATGKQGPAGLTGPAGPLHTRTFTFIATSSAEKEVVLGGWTLGLSCVSNPGGIFHDEVSASTSGSAQLVIVSELPADPPHESGVFGSGAVLRFSDAAARQTRTSQVLNLSTDEGLTLVASRMRNGTGCRMIVTASTTSPTP